MENLLNFVLNHKQQVSEFTLIRFDDNGRFSEKVEKTSYDGLIEWITKYPKYVRKFNLKTGKILIGSFLYILK